MVCPYCKKEIENGLVYCPNCGQIISGNESQDKVDSYWEDINHKDEIRFKQSESFIEKERLEIKNRNKKKAKLLITLLIIGILVVISFSKYQQYQTEMISEVKEGLFRKTFTTRTSHSKGFSIYYEYYQLTFKEKDKVIYAYIKTQGPAEDDEKPVVQGTYPYNVVRTFTGKYRLNVHGVAFELKVDEENIPKGIRVE